MRPMRPPAQRPGLIPAADLLHLAATAVLVVVLLAGFLVALALLV